MSVHDSAAHELHSLQGARVLVLGDVMLDRYLSGEAQRMSPEAPVPVLLEQATRLVLGGAANVAANIASVGARAVLVGRVGDDPDGEDLVALLEASGIECTLVRVEGVPTTTKTRVVSGAQQVARIDREVLHPTTPDEVAAARSALDAFLAEGGPKGVVLADYAKGFLGPELIHEVIDRAGRAGVPVVTDPKSRDVVRYAGSTVIKPNLAEARAACPDPVRVGDGGDEVGRLADAYLRLSGARNVVLSCWGTGSPWSGPTRPG